MLQVFADTGFDVEQRYEGGEVHVHLRIAPSDRFLDAVDRRDHAAVDRSLQPFFQPRAVAVIGASARPGAIGGAVFRNIVDGRLHRPRRPRQPVGRARRGRAGGARAWPS